MVSLPGCQMINLASGQPVVEGDSQESTAAATAIKPTEAATVLKPEIGAAAMDTARTQTGSETTDGAAIVDPALVQQLRELLDLAEWQVDLQWSVLNAGDECPSRRWRWRLVFPVPQKLSPQLADLSRRYLWLWQGHKPQGAEHDHAGLHAALAELQSEQNRSGATAAILLGRLDPIPPQASATSLQAIVQAGSADAERPHLNTQCAAAESWCRVLLEQSQEDAEIALAPVGLYMKSPAVADELVATLWRALAASIAPDRLPRLAETLSTIPATSGTSKLQIGGLEACVIAAATQRKRDADSNPYRYQEQVWPPRMLGWRLSDDSLSRQLMARWAAWAQHPLANSLLQSQRRDAQVHVRHAAIVSLGLLDQEASWNELRSVAQEGTDPERAIAVYALARLGLQELEPFLASDRAAVRQAVAKALMHEPTTHAAALLQKLLSDADPEVQSAAIATAVSYPPTLAVPLLLSGVQEGSFATRKTAQRALSQLNSEMPEFPLDGNLEARRQAVHDYATSQGIELVPWLTAIRTSAADGTLATSTNAATQRLAGLIAVYLSTDAQSPTYAALRDELWKLATASDVPLLETAIRDQRSVAARSVQMELLPRLSSNYAAVRDLTSSDVLRRRNAAKVLQTAAVQHPLSPDLVRQLNEPLSREQDQQVWQSCLAAVQSDGHAAARELALIASHQHWPDVRRLSLEYFRQHPDPEVAAALLPLLKETNPRLQIAAADVLGLCGNPQAIQGFPATSTSQSTGGLRDLLTSPHVDVQWAVLTALVRLRDDAAFAELVRRLESTDTAIRLQAVRAMGLSQQPRCIEPLIRHVWTDYQSTVRLSVLDALNQLVAIDEQPRALTDGLAATRSIDDNVHIWVEWWEARSRRPITAAAIQGVESVDQR